MCQITCLTDVNRYFNNVIEDSQKRPKKAKAVYAPPAGQNRRH